MDVLNNETEHLFLLPVALIFQNESSADEQNVFKYNSTTMATVNVTRIVHDWKKEDLLNDFQRLVKIGDVIRKELKWAFILHTYGFGCLFFILAFYTFFSILNLRSFISSRPFMSTINGFLCLLGTSRAASLLIDPYNLKENMPKIFGQILWDLGFPSIISAFCLVQLAFLQFTQLRVGPEGLRRKSCLSLIVTAHFLLTIGIDIVVASHDNLMVAKKLFEKTVKYVIQYIFLLWGVFLCSNFLYSGYKVMSMIRTIPGILKHRDLPDAGYKGVLQLAMMSPQNNLGGSMTAALLPTLCAPKIHQQDNTSLSTVGFRNDGNSRILESESIPMLEDVTGSSGDEISPKPLIRASSFQNQTRNSQKFNHKPKLSFKSISDEPRNEELGAQGKHLGPKSPKSTTPKNQSPKNWPVKANEFDFNVKIVNGTLRHAENVQTIKNVHELKSQLLRRTGFENENFRFSNEKKSRCKSSSNSNLELQTSCGDGPIPEILVSCSVNPNNETETNDENENKSAESGNNRKILNKLMNEISRDLNEMQILREEKISKSEEIVVVHESRRKQDEYDIENESKTKGQSISCGHSGRIENFTGTRANQLYERGSKNNCFRKEKDHQMEEKITEGKDSLSMCSALKEITKFERVVPQKKRCKKKEKSLSWKNKAENTEEDNAAHECLLLQETSTDVTLRSVLNQIAYMNRGAQSNVSGEDDLEKVRKSKVEWVLNITYITAMWGLMLCLSNMGKIYSPFGLPEPRRMVPALNTTYLQDVTPSNSIDRGILFSSWPWLWFQTFCRALELAMGCAMANITRQPAANHRYSRALTFRHRDTFYNI